MGIELYEEMNEKIADIIAICDDAPSLYASAYIKHLKKENEKLKCEKELAEVHLKEILSALYQRTGEEELDGLKRHKGFTLYRKDIVELAKDYGIKEGELK